MSVVEASRSTRSAQPKYRVQDIEQALRWAYQHELPKKREDRAITGPMPTALHPMWRAGAFGGRIDCWHRDPGFPLAMGDPHPDALRIEAAVDLLDEDRIDIAVYDIGAGLGTQVDLRHVIALVRRDLRSWIITFARNGKRPALGGGPECEPAMSDNGKATVWRTIQASCGTDAKGLEVFTTHDVVTTTRGDTRDTGTFCKLHWTRTAEDVAEERAMHALWHAALRFLADDLAEVLQDMAVTPPLIAAQPWAEPEPVVRPILANVAKPRRSCLDQRRPVGRREPLPRRRAEPVRRVSLAGGQPFDRLFLSSKSESA